MSQTKAQLLDGKASSIEFSTGSASSPTISFTGDTNTGIYSSGTDQVSITTSGTERLRVDATGQIESVSLGTASAPTYSWTGDPNTGIYSPGADQIAISTNGTERMRLDSSGRLGLGNSSPGVTLDVTGAIRASTTVTDVAGNVRVIPQNSKTSSYTLLASDLGKHISITTGGITVPASIFSVGDAVSIYNNSSSSQTITQGSSTTLRQAGTANTGNRTLAQYGIATILCVASNTFVISGAGLT